MYGDTLEGATTGTPANALPTRLTGTCPVPPVPSWRAFCSTVRSSVSIARSPPVIAQRKMSIVWLVAQLRKLPLHRPEHVAVEPAGCSA